jgi:hypothetical protein
MKKKLVSFIFCLFLIFPAIAQNRSLDAIFPGISPEIRLQIFSGTGFIKPSVRGVNFSFLPSELNPRITGRVQSRQLSCLIESVFVVPVGEEKNNLLTVYNALGKVSELKRYRYHSESRNMNIPLFDDATRIVSPKNSRPVADPKPAAVVPEQEAVFLKLRDTNFGNSYYRGDVLLNDFGLLYSMSNYKNITYLFIPVIRENNFFAQLYFEPLKEGILVYGIAGADVSNFISSNIDIPSAIAKRLQVIISWVVDGINNTY